MKKNFFLFSLLAFSFFAKAQCTCTPFKEIPIEARFITADQTGNVYVVRNNNELVRFDEKGDSTAAYQNTTQGVLQQVDVANPLKILLYYPAFSKLVVLDKQLAVKNEFNLQSSQLLRPTIIAHSIQNRVWVYDEYQATLKLVDEQMNTVMQTKDLRQELQTVPNITSIVEADWKVLLCDKEKGVYVFDFAGNYVHTISIFTKNIRMEGNQIHYLQNDTLYAWDKFKFNHPLIPLPKGKTKILDALIHKKNLVVLYEDRVVYYKVVFKEY